MSNKKAILTKTEQFLSDKKSFAYRVCKLLKDGEFNRVLSSVELTRLLNEGAGKKIKASGLTSLMKLLQEEDIVKVKIIVDRKLKKKFWFPGWIDKAEVEKELVEIKDNNVLFFTGQNSWSDPNKNFPKIIEMLEGDICILDPYYGNGTFYVLEKFGKTRKIRFLTSQVGNEEQANPAKFEIGLKRFKKEFKNIEMRKYDKFYELHDRYVIGKNALVIIGHGIKDLANKESFVVFLPEELVKGFLDKLKKIFEQRWSKSVNIS